MANFIDFVSDKNYARKILKVLKKANEHFPHLCLKQLCSNIYFPGALVTYLENTDLKDLAGDAFILLINVFDDSSVKEATPNFIKKLIDASVYIVDEDTLNALISILVVCLPHFQKIDPDSNIIL